MALAYIVAAVASSSCNGSILFSLRYRVAFKIRLAVTFGCSAMRSLYFVLNWRATSSVLFMFVSRRIIWFLTYLGAPRMARIILLWQRSIIAIFVGLADPQS